MAPANTVLVCSGSVGVVDAGDGEEASTMTKSIDSPSTSIDAVDEEDACDDEVPSEVAEWLKEAACARMSALARGLVGATRTR